MRLDDISTGTKSSRQVVLKKEYYREQDKFYKGLKADPDNPVRTTNNLIEARKWNHLSDARRFCKDNKLDEYGFEARVVNRNI
jgi:hypothetical protein